MVILTVDKSKEAERAALLAAVIALKNGGVIAFPTETVYGLGCDPTNADAVKRIYRMKGRTETKPLQIIAGNMKQVKQIAELSRDANRVTKLHWPGPLTLLLPVKKGLKLNKKVIQDDMIGIRVTSDEFLQKLLKLYGKPIAATSANKTGDEPARSGKRIQSEFSIGLKPNLLIDKGSIPKRKPTTVAELTEQGIRILRQGGLRIKGAFQK